MSLFRYYVSEFPNETSRMGKVLWTTGTNDKDQAKARAVQMGLSNPWKDYDVTDMQKA